MSNKLQGMAWSLPLPANAKLVLVTLADAASDDEGVCWIGNQLLRTKTSVKRTSITYILFAFEAMGIIRRGLRFRENGGQSSSFKYLTIPFLKKEEEGAFLEKYNIAYRAARISKKTPCHSVTGGEGSHSDTGVVTQSDTPHVTQSDHQEPLSEPSFGFEEEEDACEVEIIVDTPRSLLPALVIPLAMKHLPATLIEQAIDKAVLKLARTSPVGFRRKCLKGLAAGDEGWIETVFEFVKQIEASRATSEAPWVQAKIDKRNAGMDFQNILKENGYNSIFDYIKHRQEEEGVA